MPSPSPSWLPDSLGLVPHPSARAKCVARTQFNPGSRILSTPAYAAILLDTEKGRRCDSCFRLTSDEVSLKRCSGCGSYWYCDTKCQSIHWKAHHKRICKIYNSFLLSLEYQALPMHQKLDAILLSHALATLSLLPSPYIFQEDVSSVLLMSLLPYSDESIHLPPICPITPPPPDELVRKLYSRFGNNNFAIHSHLTTIAHGIFPQASRLFNHSCTPNSAAKYIFLPNKSIRMDVIALRDINQGEEICLTYLDPALLETREQLLEISHGFKCQCTSSLFLRRIGRLPILPSTASEISHISEGLRRFVGVESLLSHLPVKQIETIPPSLYCVLRESYMTGLSEIFSQGSHQGQYDIAIDSGMTLLSLYILVYPVNYPQIGMHLLEMAKTVWNAVITSTDHSIERPLKQRAWSFLMLAEQIMTVFGPEGDDGGPLQEIAILRELLDSDLI
ncbi:hypothetical protein BDN70DRAFT_883477 [Pholiota conissans]|uniref:SET domain-containing protein n=1 Tax=Pholiota conissans TaxID=109636 RepID=A0A9P5YUG2_9AGAR|nr:hypothetical protein BDN70DRAFT_883477 [Pholiota conissans]